MNAARKPKTHSAASRAAAKVVLMPSLPMHSQIREIIRPRVLNGSYASRSQMPSEAQMMAAFQVSRITIRQALGDLQKEGLIS